MKRAIPDLPMLLNRRTVLSGLLGLGPVVLGGRAAAKQVGTQFPPELAKCTATPGVQPLIEFIEGVPVFTFEEVLPPTDWQLYSSPVLPLAFHFPADWLGELWWASSFSAAGAPVWTAEQPLQPVLFTMRVVSPDRSALWESVNGTFTGLALDTFQAATIAELGVMGDGAALTPQCHYVEPGIGNESWFRTSQAGAATLVTNGTVFANTSGLYPFTVLTYTSYYGPAESFEQLVRQVYIPIQYQLLRAPSFSVTPTPEP